MSVAECIVQAVKDGKISPEGAAEYQTRMADAEALADQRGLAGPEKYIFATTEAAKTMEARATAKRAQVQQTILAIDRAWDGAKANSRGTGYGLTDIFSERIYGEGTGNSLGQQHYGNLKIMQNMMGDYLSKIQSKLAGLKQNQILPQHLVRALYGDAVSDPAAQQAAKAWVATMDWWRNSMHGAAIPVGEVRDFYLPQHWDPLAVRSIGREGFVAQMEDWWHSGKLGLRDWEADGQAYMAPGIADARAREIFERAYDNITTGGDASLDPGALQTSTLADKYSRRRAFEWMDSNGWLEFNDKFGVGNDGIGELTSRHLDRSARDLATAQVLGPDPDRAAKTLIQMYRKDGGGRFWANKLEAIYDMQSGKTVMPVSTRLALGAQSLRQFLSGAQLGGAILSSASDFGFTKAVSNWYGLDMTKLMAEYVGNLKPKSMADRAEAMRSVTIQEVGLRGLHNTATDVIGDIRGTTGAGNKADAALNGIARATGRLAEVVIRAQGLAHHTQALRDSVGSGIMAKLADIAGKPMAELSGIEQRFFRDYGITAKDWDTIRTNGLNQGFIDPFKLSQSHGALGAKLLGAIANVQRVAIPEGNTITRAIMLGNTRPGTLVGEFARSFAQYRGFPMGAFMMHYFRALESLTDREGQWFRGQYIAGLVVSTTVLGALSMQLKNIAAGKDPEPMYGDHGVKFWAQAVAQGGALGVIGQYLQAIYAAKRLDDPSRLLTPMGGLGLDTAQLILGGLHGEANQSRTETTAKQGAKMLRKYTPGVFYTKLAMDRLVHDTVTRWADPEAANTFSRMEENARKQQETRFYWRPGTEDLRRLEVRGPQRAPDLSRAVP